MKQEALNELEKLSEWLDGLGQSWNLFGHVDRGKQHLKNAIEAIKQIKNNE